MNIKKMKRFLKTGFLSLLIFWNLSCTPYLDIVPDNTTTLEDYFSRKEMAWNALSKVYSYLPNIPMAHYSPWLLGDEWLGRPDMDYEDHHVIAIRIMRGLQNTQTPLLGSWSGTGGGKALYQAIRSANIFIDYIDQAQDMSDEEIAEWKAQAKFLKAYYHFSLLQQYGPIVIVDKSVALDATNAELFQDRSKIEDCFDFIIKLIDEAIPYLKDQVDESELGQVDKMVALAIKARILLFRASPFFNGNTEFYSDFLDHDGQPFFPLEKKPEKWKDALDAVEEAITFCKANGIDLYTFDKYPYGYDREDIVLNPDTIQKLYDLRMVIVDPWNKELIWGQTYEQTLQGDENGILAHFSNTVLQAVDYKSGVTNNTRCSEGWLGATYQMLERYYTKNGLPITEDLSFSKDWTTLVRTPGAEDPAYRGLRGVMQPGQETISLYLNRELRFYANLVITGGYWRSHSERVPSQLYPGHTTGFNTDFGGAYFYAGVGVQKMVHPESKSGRWERAVRYPYPIIRMADLYLMKAEILNEVEGPSQRVYDALNVVRRRAGIPDVEVAWSNPELLSLQSLNKHLDKDELREIILQERSIELAFEGQRFWDMHRYKRASSEFSNPVMGWDYMNSGEKFFILSPKQIRRFLARDYLWPISITERNKNGNLIQNPGW
jgi:hypothetical protein